MQGQIEPSMKERLESLNNLSMLTPSGILEMDFFPKTKYYSLNLTITWEQVNTRTPYQRVPTPITKETSRKSKTQEYVVKWAAGGSLEKELMNIRPREKWHKLSDDLGTIYFDSDMKFSFDKSILRLQAENETKSIQQVQTQVENDTIPSLSLTLEVANVYVNTEGFISGREIVFVDGERRPWWRST